MKQDEISLYLGCTMNFSDNYDQNQIQTICPSTIQNEEMPGLASIFQLLGFCAYEKLCCWIHAYASLKNDGGKVLT